jgi:citrate synthase
MKNTQLKISGEDPVNFAVQKLINKKLNKKQRKLLNILFEIFHTMEFNELTPASSMICFMMSGAGLDFPQVVSSSVNCFGKNHGCFTKMAQFMLGGFKTNEKYYPGFGHSIYKKEDPRVKFLIEKIMDLKLKCPTVQKCIKFSQKKKITLNIGGASVAILLDLGFDEDSVNYFPIISRMLGWLLIYKKIKRNKIKFITSLDSIEKYQKFFVKNS